MIARWIEEKTTLAGQPYSYLDHEYQERILGDTSRDVVSRKCAQIGMSEASVRMALALVNVISPYTLAYTLPTANFAGTFTKTRVDPVIQGSSAMKSAVHTTNDNTELKQFGDSFLFIRGAASSNAPISIPCDHLVHDEVDFSDQEVLGQYVSRLGHSKWKRTHKFSTPTLPNFGIDRAFRETRRHFLMCRCDHCNDWFIPDYYKHVRIPDFLGDLREINKAMLARVRWREAYVTCPHCGGRPSLQKGQREWVCENQDEPHVAAGYQVSPFDAPNVIKPSELVEASTRYDRIQDFINFNLGLPAEDRESTLTRQDMEHLFVHGDPGSGMAYVMGVDVGAVYHFAIGAVDGWGEIFVVHAEQVPMGQARRRYRELREAFRVGCTLIDSGPHAETVMALQDEDPNLYAVVSVRLKSIVTHQVVDREADADKGQSFQRQVNMNRNRALDAYMNYLRENHLRIRDSDEREVIVAHHTSMKRVKVFDNESGELAYSWQKTDGVDHYHHSFVFMWLAARIRGVSRALVQLPIGAMMSFRHKPKE